LTWRVLKDNYFPTKKNFIHMGLMMEHFCPKRCFIEEDIDHLFKECVR